MIKSLASETCSFEQEASPRGAQPIWPKHARGGYVDLGHCIAERRRPAGQAAKLCACVLAVDPSGACARCVSVPIIACRDLVELGLLGGGERSSMADDEEEPAAGG